MKRSPILNPTTGNIRSFIHEGTNITIFESGANDRERAAFIRNATKGDIVIDASTGVMSYLKGNRTWEVVPDHNSTYRVINNAVCRFNVGLYDSNN